MPPVYLIIRVSSEPDWLCVLPAEASKPYSQAGLNTPRVPKCPNTSQLGTAMFVTTWHEPAGSRVCNTTVQSGKSQENAEIRENAACGFFTFRNGDTRHIPAGSSSR
ncbi:hypothetical protein P3T21_001211 [Paraburkholderia sp. GAS334]